MTILRSIFVGADVPSLYITLDAGCAPVEFILELFESLNHLSVVHGGNGMQFEVVKGSTPSEEIALALRKFRADHDSNG